MSKRVFRWDTVQLHPSKIEEYDHPIMGPVTVFKDVVIAREIIHKYDDGNAYKPAKELEDAYWTAEGQWNISGGHPNTGVIMDRDQIHGRTVNSRFTKSLKDPKTGRTNNRGIVADLEVFNNRVTPQLLSDMRSGLKSDVSIGFFFNQDDTPGTIEEDGHPLNGVAYDYVQRKIDINHVAFGIDKGRCSMPYCGIGADEITMYLAGDPFGKWEKFEDCVKDIMKENPDYTEEQASATCASIEKKSKEKKDAFTDFMGVMEDMKEKIDLVITHFAGADAPRTEAERAQSHFNISEEEWGKLSEEKKQKYIDKLPARGTAGQESIDTDEKGEDTFTSEEFDLKVMEYFNISRENWEQGTEEMRGYLKTVYEERHTVVDAGEDTPEKQWWEAFDWKTNKKTYELINDDVRKLVLEAGLCPDCSEAKTEDDNAEPEPVEQKKELSIDELLDDSLRNKTKKIVEEMEYEDRHRIT